MARLNRSMLSTLLIIGLFVMSAHANAAIDASSIDNMIEKFQTAASTWQAPLLNYATNLFWILAFIQFSWAMIGLAKSHILKQPSTTCRAQEPWPPEVWNGGSPGLERS